MTIRSFTGYRNSDLFGAENPNGSSTFNIATTPTIEILMADGANDFLVEGDSDANSASTEQSEDAENDQFLYIRDGSTVVADGTTFYLELIFQFQVNGQNFTGYHFEDENGLNFTVLPPDVPAGQASITGGSYTPNPDEVNYDALSSGTETIDDSLFTQLNLSGDDDIDAGEGNDTVDAGGGSDTVQGGFGNDTIDGGAGDDIIYGDMRFGINGQLEAGQADNSFGFNAVDGWFNTGSGGLIETWGNTYLGTSTDDGGGFIELDVNGGNSGVDHLQTNLELTTGVEYIITIDHAARSGAAVNDDFEVTHNGNVIATVSPSSVGYFTTSSFTITGLAGTDTIGFREIAGQSDGLGVLLDDFTVSLSDTGVAGSNIDFDDVIDGGEGDDLIYAQEGDDTITGGEGNDVISTGVGSDTIRVTDGGGSDTITDFVIGEDTLDVTGLTDANGDVINAADVTVTSDGENGSILTFANGEQTTLRDIAPENLDTVAELNAIGIPCFTKGTMIETADGAVRVEDLSSGMLVRVGAGADDYAPLRLNLNRHVTSGELARNGKLAPVRIAAGALGQNLPSRDLLVSRQHRMVVQSAVAERMFGTSEVLVSAVRLTALPDIEIDHSVDTVDYFHLVFDNHEIIFAEGAPTESFLTAPEGIKALSDDAREELFTLFPMIEHQGYAPQPAHFIPCNTRQKNLVTRHLKNGKDVLAKPQLVAAKASGVGTACNAALHDLRLAG